MSLYNLLFGVNRNADTVLAMVNLKRDDVGRFRDAYITTRAGDPVVVVHTRNGGGNRDHWSFTYEDEEEGADCPCPGCIISHVLPAHPLYLFDEDDDFDCTYADIYFRVPAELREVALLLVSDEPPPAEKWRDLLNRLNENESDDPTVKNALEVGRAILGPIVEQVQLGQLTGREDAA